MSGRSAEVMIIVFLVAMVLALFVGFMIATSADAANTADPLRGKYPPDVAALVKLKKAVTFPAGRAMNKWRHLRVQRNLTNAYRMNKTGCFGITSDIDKAGYYSERNEHGLAMVYAQRAINKAYKCRDVNWRKK